MNARFPFGLPFGVTITLLSIIAILMMITGFLGREGVTSLLRGWR